MRLLHTSDWHLGHRLCEKDRQEEHARFLNWLITQLNEEEIDLLIVAGDIFDTAYPPNFALTQYYNFLRQVTDTCCSQVIIIGGNHDSVSTLNAPKELLKYFKIYVIGGTEGDISQEVIPIEDKSGTLKAVVCAIPFLRDRDIKKAVAGETYEAKEKAIIKGIVTHYHEVKEQALRFIENSGNNLIPLIATGHLYAAGCLNSDSEKDIYIGNLGQVAAESMPSEFYYLALGHLHRGQVVSGHEHIQYSGSPIPLSFSEAHTKKTVNIVEFDTEGSVNVVQREIPLYRKLVQFKGPIEKIEEKLSNYDNHDDILTPWAEVVVEMKHFEPDLHNRIMTYAQDLPLEILMVRIDKQFSHKSLNEQVEHFSLNELTPEEVFLKKCQSLGESFDIELALKAFQELQSLMEKND